MHSHVFYQFIILHVIYHVDLRFENTSTPWMFHFNLATLYLNDPAKEENALKAKLRRMCEKKKGGKLQVPEWLHEEWLNGDHLTMARQLESCGFDKETLTNVAKNLHISMISSCQFVGAQLIH